MRAFDRGRTGPMTMRTSQRRECEVWIDHARSACIWGSKLRRREGRREREREREAGAVRMQGAKHCCCSGSGRGVELLQGQRWGGEPGMRVARVTVRAVSGNGQGGGGSGRERAGAVSSGKGARERRLQKVAEERKRKQSEVDDKYPEWATILENATKDDVELREIIGDAIGNPEEMRRRVEERVRRKGRDVLQQKTGSANPMVVSFRDFDHMDSYIWVEFYAPPTDKDIELIGSVFRSFFVLGRLGGFNSMNMQLTRLPLNSPYKYSTEQAKEALDAFFHNISDVEFQDNWGRIWVDLGTSDPVCLDVLINALTNVSSDHVGIKQLVFGGKNLGDWDEDLTSDQPDFRSYKI